MDVSTLGQKKNTFLSCCPTDPNILVPTLNFLGIFRQAVLKSGSLFYIDYAM